MNKTLSIGSIIKTLRRYHLTLFIVVVVGGLIVAVLTLNTIIDRSINGSGIVGGPGATSFDQATINRLNNLGSDSNNQMPTSGRVNPFTE
ncbi:MAG TPA: hypothetical protein VFS65_02570 [Candidatus Saccharimonadales bacterium]|nr:hypothetical protein [Candidatus Saccharimonadales bacterium]